MRFCLAISLIFLLSSCSKTKNSLYGYIEAEYLYLSPTSPGLLKDLYVKRGQFVEAGKLLYKLDRTLLKADLQKSQAQYEKAKANLSDLLKGKREEELLVIEKRLEKIKAELENAKTEYERAKNLLNEGAVSKSYYDKWKSSHESKLADYESTKAELKVAMLKSRSDEIDAARAETLIYEQEIIKAEKQIEDSQAIAIKDAYIEETFFQEGEHVKAGESVLSLLIPEDIKVIFFVSQNLIATLKLGDKILIDCDGCEKTFEAKISYISSQAEFSPPVIYSNESRDKLVYQIEARFINEGIVLSPGLPVDVKLES